jgi:hypothetical protein
LAQRAYRLRKETTIASLKGQVASLHATIEEMNKTFLQFNDNAVASGILHMSPELARELKNATEQFILLAKSASHSSGDEHSDSEVEEVTRQIPTRSQPSASRRDIPILGDQQHRFPSGSSTSPEPSADRIVDIGMGYVQVLDDETSASPPPMESQTNSFADSMQLDNNPALDRYDSVMDSFPLFPYSSASTSTDTMAISAPIALQSQQYNVRIPTPPLSILRSPTKSMTIPSPYTYSFQETTFARRLQRAALERGFHLLSNADLRPAAFNRVFKLSLLYHSREKLLAKFRKALTNTSEEPLETLQTPFIHLGGAGLHYNTGRVQNGYIVKPGPLYRQARLESADSPGVSLDIDFDLNEYEGQWFDSNDVEGYLEEKGLRIDPQSTFAEGQVQADLSGILSETPEAVFSPARSPSVVDNATIRSATTSPQTPVLSETALELGTQRLFPELSGWETGSNSAWDSAATGWLMGSGDKTPDFLSSGWLGVEAPSAWDFSDSVGTSMNDFSATNLANPPQSTVEPVKRQVTIDVSKLIDGEYFSGAFLTLNLLLISHRTHQDWHMPWSCSWLQEEGRRSRFELFDYSGVLKGFILLVI